MFSLGHFIGCIPSAALWPWGRVSLKLKIAPGVSSDSLTTYMCRLSGHAGSLTASPVRTFLGRIVKEHTFVRNIFVKNCLSSSVGDTKALTDGS
jgi:hypothetical protein